MNPRVPLAEKMRPTKLIDVVGQDKLLGDNQLLREIVTSKLPTSLILWGPPGSGKTTLARIIASEIEAEFVELSAVTSGKKDVEQVVEHARQNWNLGLRTILFVDEIHRFNKAQQDAFLPHVESGLITLIGATTENPSFEVINPLLSRMKVLVLEPLTTESIIKILNRALKELGKTKSITPAAVKLIAELSSGDARSALGNLEIALGTGRKVTPDTLIQLLQANPARYDKAGDSHYDLVSAFIKSLRGGSERAALYYMTRMLAGGEDPKFIARRMIVFASEDIGLAGNGALSLAVASFQAVERVGLPEAKYNLYHAAVALARSAKSREITDLMHGAESLVAKYPNAKVPLHLRNAPTKLANNLEYGKGYKWQAGFKPNQGFLPKEVK